MSRAQSIAVALTFALSALDGYDVLAMTFAAPGVTHDWGVGKGVLGLALSAGLVGMALGSLVLAPLADVVGCRKMVVANLLIMTVGMALSALSSSIGSLIAWRIVTGIGIGAMVPIIAPLSAEYANERRRPLAIAIMSIGYPVGATVGGFIAAVLLRFYDWRAVFLFGSGMALLLLPAVLRWLLEPPEFLIERPGEPSLFRLNDYLFRCGVDPVDALPAPTRRSTETAYSAIFAREQRGTTLMITAVNFLYTTTVYFVLSWMSQIVADAGFSASTATALAALAALAGVFAQLFVGVASARAGRRMLVPAVMLAAAGTTALFGFVPASLVPLASMAALLGAFIYGGIAGLYAAIVTSFPTRMRATGVGFVLGIGRGAGALAPAVAGALFAGGFALGVVSGVLALGALAAGLLLAVARRQAA
ncbi:MFS transporter [uncultured Sphingomonas sp.]|uniref:MFS transporter n=1 Tax=uncultured Sphingomonas sp. TaxID=158754 RepID=UPI0035CB01AD